MYVLCEGEERERQTRHSFSPSFFLLSFCFFQPGGALASNNPAFPFLAFLFLPFFLIPCFVSFSALFHFVFSGYRLFLSTDSSTSSKAQKPGDNNMASSPSKTSATTPPTAPTVSQGTSNPATGPKIAPKDGQVVAAILKDCGVNEYEPRVVQQLLEFVYRYVTTVLEDAQVYSTYAKKKSIDADDVRLSVQLLQEKMFTSPPPRELLVEIARHRNSIPLPPIKSHAGPRLPSDRYSLISCNYKYKGSSKLNGAPPTPQTFTFRTGSLMSPQGRPVLIRTGQPAGIQNQFLTPDSNQGVKRKAE